MANSTYFDDVPVADEDPTKRRGRKKRETAHRIFRSAIDLMQQDGFDGVSIEQICERAGIARATFFQHFASKAALLSVLSDIICQKLDDELASEDLSPESRLRVIAEHLERLINEIGVIAPDMFAAFNAEPGGRFRVEEPSTGVTYRIKTVVEMGQADGSFSNQWSADDIASGLIAAWVAVARRWITQTETRDKAPLQRILDLILIGLTPR